MVQRLYENASFLRWHLGRIWRFIRDLDCHVHGPAQMTSKLGNPCTGTLDMKRPEGAFDANSVRQHKSAPIRLRDEEGFLEGDGSIRR